MTKVAIIFNGPPNSGKDHACDYLQAKHKINHIRFKDKLFDLVRCVYDISSEQFTSVYNREMKEIPTSLFNGLSPRQALIHMSETVIKPTFGKDYFGKAAAKKLMKDSISCFSDSGFYEEIDPVYDACDSNILIVRIHRPNCSFAGDSRQYISSYKKVPVIDIVNDSTIEDFEDKLECVYNKALMLLIKG